MENILNYLDWRGDLPFSRDPVNEVDLLIFSVLSYAAMDDLFGSDREVSLPEMTQRYVDAEIDQSKLVYDPKPAMLKAAETERYRNVLIKRYVNRIDANKEVQFSACTFQVGSRTSVIAFRGTDNTIVGWREDFNFSARLETPSQGLAVRYLNQSDDENLYLCGHSKGGNLAMYAAAFCHPEVKSRIVSVTSFDGPGFQPEILEQECYKEIIPRAYLYLPDSSFFGLMMHQNAKRRIIRSSEFGFSQHNPYSWRVKGNILERTGNLSVMSKYLDEVLDTWLARVSIAERENFIQTVFNAIESTGATTFKEMQKRKLETLNAIVKAFQNTGSEEIRTMLDTLVKLASTSGNVFLDDIRSFLGFRRDRSTPEEEKKDEKTEEAKEE